MSPSRCASPERDCLGDSRSQGETAGAAEPITAPLSCAAPDYCICYKKTLKKKIGLPSFSFDFLAAGSHRKTNLLSTSHFQPTEGSAGCSPALSSREGSAESAAQHRVQSANSDIAISQAHPGPA